jgi:hypothetical protein
MTTQQGDSISSDLDKTGRSRDSSPNFDETTSSRRAHREDLADPMPLSRRARAQTTTATTPTITSTSTDPTLARGRRPLPRQDTSESMQPEFCDEEISISVPPPKQVKFINTQTC